MAYSPVKRPLLCLALAVVAAGAAAQVTLKQTGDIIIDSASFEADLRNNVVRYRKIIATQGTLRLEADEGTYKGTGREGSTRNGEWLFNRNVRVTVDGGLLNADEARATVVDSRIQHVVVTGSPATFQHQPKEGELVRGRASTMVYNMETGAVELRGDTWFNDGDRDINGRGSTLTYNLKEETVRWDSEKEGKEHVRVTIPNPGSLQKKENTPKPTP